LRDLRSTGDGRERLNSRGDLLLEGPRTFYHRRDRNRDHRGYCQANDDPKIARHESANRQTTATERSRGPLDFAKSHVAADDAGNRRNKRNRHQAKNTQH
jgi:hypothetical protein